MNAGRCRCRSGAPGPARGAGERRDFFRRAGAAGLALFCPGCGSREPTVPAPAATAALGAGALRLDLRQRVADGAESFELEALVREPRWSGRRTRLADAPDWGDYRLSVHDTEQGVLLYRQGFDSDLAPFARAATTRLTLRMRMPARPVRVAIEKRRGEQTFSELAALTIDPAQARVERPGQAAGTRVESILTGGDPAAKVDVAILGDGYREAEYPKFAADARRAAEYLFSVDPFRARRDDFNVNAVFVPSAESGVTDPYLGIARDTAFGCAYGSGAAERTLAAGRSRALYDAAAAAPYDFLLVLANARRYGGSARYGGPAVVAIDSAAARYLVVHEFAHAVAGLADEYYVPAAGGPRYGGNVEPWQPNITTSPARRRWDALRAGPARASAWNQDEYDRRFGRYVARYEALRARGAPEETIEQLMSEERARQAVLLGKHGDTRRAGYFEGANGYARGAYRSGVDCIMFSLQSDHFCPACTAALDRAIDGQRG
ncbi:MAG: hypothetical protein IT529_18320 [Burkholderiales bacterium]|nr:hypothetical protein [Burkholderiales bacterium]